jgi:hypothetical protein
MSVRDDISINWNASPRVIEVADTSDTVTMQDLVDTLRERETDFANLSYPHIVNSAGKEALGGGVSIAITLILQNAQLKFADRSGPSFVTCYVLGGNLVAVDEDGYELDAIATSDYVHVIVVRSSSSTLIESATSGLTDEEAEQLAEIEVVSSRTTGVSSNVGVVSTKIDGISGDIGDTVTVGRLLAFGG